MTREVIIDRLMALGFAEATKGWTAKDRLPALGMRHPSVEQAGSVYVATDYLSATGPYKRFQDQVSPSGSDHKGGPYWSGHDLEALLSHLAEVFRPVLRSSVGP